MVKGCLAAKDHIFSNCYCYSTFNILKLTLNLIKLTVSQPYNVGNAFEFFRIPPQSTPFT